MPFTTFYILPFVMDLGPRGWMQFSAVSLVLIPLCFGYAVIRYRLMDVDIIFKRGLAYTAATAGVAAVYFALVALLAQIFHAQTTGPGRRHDRHRDRRVSVSAVSRMDASAPGRFFYRDRLDYRRTLIEFGRTLTNEVRLEPMLGSVMDRVSQTLLVDRLAIFQEDPVQSWAHAAGAFDGRAFGGTHGS